jgi:REP element-mobilizing transposase RayT
MKKLGDELYKNRYRIKSTRLSVWDYSSNGYYFVTICTKNRESYFGEIIETQNLASLQMTKIGKIAENYWLEIPNHFPFVVLDKFVIMPNHIHGILAIDHPDVETQHVETQNLASLRKQNTFGPQSKNLASIIRGFKIGIKKYASMNNIAFAWQSRFYEHIIRTDKDLNRIRQYIIDNPGNWKTDELFTENNNDMVSTM